MEQYSEHYSQNNEIQQINSSVSRVFNSLYKNKLLNDPVIKQGIVFSGTSDNTIPHSLGRPVTGYLILQINAGQTIYTSSAINTAPSANIILKATGTVTADIMFF